MTIKFDNVYLKSVATVACKDEKEGTFGNLYDKTYDSYYADCKTFEQAEIKLIKDAVSTAIDKANIDFDDVDVIIASDLLNQITASSYSSVSFKRPYLGIYNACASLCEGYILAGSLLQNKEINNVLVNVSCHNMTAERQYRNPVEYGCPKPKRATFTVTGSASAVLTNEKTNIKVSSVTIGVTTSLGSEDVYDMGTAMAPSAARTIYEHLQDTKKTIDNYDLILTGDLGVYGKEILREYLKEEYKIEIEEKLEDAASIIYDRKKQNHVKAGGSGPACIGLVTYTNILNKMEQGKLKKVLLVATGALMSPTMNNQKLTIPSISHAVSLEVV